MVFLLILVKKKGDHNLKIYCCLEHTELALDVAVDEIELAPVFKEITEDERNHVCEYCENPALYTVGN